MVDGSSFLDFTATNFERWGIPSGPAKKIEKLISPLDSMPSSLSVSVGLFLFGLSQIQGGKQDTFLHALAIIPNTHLLLLCSVLSCLLSSNTAQKHIHIIVVRPVSEKLEAEAERLNQLLA